jgi:chaperonin GroES
MSVLLDEKDLDKLIVIGDRILIRPKVPQSKTKSGLLLPPGVNENEKVQIGYVMKVGPGYPIPSVNDVDEIEFNNEKYIVVSHSSILLLLRDNGLFE